MRCKFCFATFQDVKQTVLPKGHLPKESAIKLMYLICSTNVEKITFAGGEPTLCPWLYDLIAIAKSHNKTTMVVTNGSRIDKEWINKYEEVLDWITLSVDSINDKANIYTGRAITGKKPINVKSYLTICNYIMESKIRLKINTVVSAFNKNENLSKFINKVNPKRWKILQALPIKGQNDLCISKFTISDSEFQNYVQSQNVNQQVIIVTESNDDMTNSYLMIDPAGRFYQNTNSRYEYSIPILDEGIIKAAKSIDIDVEKFNRRGGRYEWKTGHNIKD